ncbi:hypothetical protein ONE63_004768 [Megalurothrips usitatus]|uniref:Lipase n=1 Tax=Megalurothrips usitatus TaxID=439358 RepID=A0AAV7X4B1_9NEOP|nr:hypothetical protein ONE63_004768 [Megalurothrips usitatus]
MTGPELILHWGYPGEGHALQTDDGYVLTMFRVPRGRSRGGDKQPSELAAGPRPVVFLQHGLFQTADQWLMRGPGEDLAFILADLGFDVWMGNFRGSTYSRKHVRLSPQKRKFWDFGWQENALYDLPAMLDYVSAVTEQESMFYVGHSMGTTTILGLLAARPEYNRRVRAAFLMAPVAYFQHTWGALAAAKSTAGSLANARLIGELFPRGSGDACKNVLPLCISLYNSAGGYSPREFNMALFQILVGHFPSGASYGQLTHYLQMMVTGEFKMCDYGAKENLARYGQPKPPPFRLSNVVAPVFLHVSEGDAFSPIKDQKRLASEIPGFRKMIKVPLRDFGHTDHLYAIHTYQLEYKQIISIMLDMLRSQ